MTDHRDIPPDNGKRPDFAQPTDEGLGKVGTGGGYSGQEYDSAGQAEWRAGQAGRTASPDGAAHGSGAGAGDAASGEEFDAGTAGAGVDPSPAGASPGLGMTHAAAGREKAR